MNKERLLKHLFNEYNKAYDEIVEGILISIPVKNGEEKKTFYKSTSHNWGLTTCKKRKNGGKGDITTFERLKKLVQLGLITENDFANYQGDVNLHKLIGSNNSDAKYIMFFLLNRINEKQSRGKNREKIQQVNKFDEFAIEEEYLGVEGAKKKVLVNYYERDYSLRKRKIEVNKGDCSCSICGFNFEKVYGDRGKGFIHVHHLIPLSEIGKVHDAPLDTLILVCPNCHAMLHRTNPVLKPDDLKKLIEENKYVIQLNPVCGSEKLKDSDEI